jgi:hypothetical protein
LIGRYRYGSGNIHASHDNAIFGEAESQLGVELGSGSRRCACGATG